MNTRDAGERTGEEVVKNFCAMCHATGVHVAPRVGDDMAWEPRARQGLSGPTKNALKGYMVNHSIGSWIEPIDRRGSSAVRTGEQIVRGGMADLTDVEMRSAVAYIFQRSVADGRTLP